MHSRNKTRLALAALLIGLSPSMVAHAQVADTALSKSERAELVRLRQEVKDLRRGKRQVAETKKQAEHREPSQAYAAVRRDYKDIIDRNQDSDGQDAFKQFFFLRRTPIEAAYYLYPNATGIDPKGAAISLTQDELAKTTNLSIQSFSSYVLYREKVDNGLFGRGADDSNPHLTRIAIAPFIYANGQLGEPRRASESSALQFGIDHQFEVMGGGWFPVSVARLTPYAQTDFRGLASIGGLSASYEPTNYDYSLGGTIDNGPKYVSYYFRTIAEVDVFRVDNPGLTDFAPRSSYAYLGGTAQINAALFRNMPSMKELCGRINLQAQYQYYRDVVNSRDIRNFHSAITIDLLGKQAELCHQNGEPVVKPPGTVGLSLSYDQGTDKTTLIDAKKYLLQLSLKY